MKLTIRKGDLAAHLQSLDRRESRILIIILKTKETEGAQALQKLLTGAYLTATTQIRDRIFGAATRGFVSRDNVVEVEVHGTASETFPTFLWQLVDDFSENVIEIVEEKAHGPETWY